MRTKQREINSKDVSLTKASNLLGPVVKPARIRGSSVPLIHQDIGYITKLYTIYLSEFDNTKYSNIFLKAVRRNAYCEPVCIQKGK